LKALATIGALIEVTPWDDLQYWADEHSGYSFVHDGTPFLFRVEGELIDEGVFYGLHGMVESGPKRYLGLTCSILLRGYDSIWQKDTEDQASFRVAPTVVKRCPDYDSIEHDDIPFYYHSDGIFVEGYPRVSRFGGIKVVNETGDSDIVITKTVSIKFYEENADEPFAKLLDMSCESLPDSFQGNILSITGEEWMVVQAEPSTVRKAIDRGVLVELRLTKSERAEFYGQLDVIEPERDVKMTSSDWVQTVPIIVNDDYRETLGYAHKDDSPEEVYERAMMLSMVRNQHIKDDSDGVYCPLCHIANIELSKQGDPCPQCERPLLRFGWNHSIDRGVSQLDSE